MYLLGRASRARRWSDTRNWNRFVPDLRNITVLGATSRTRPIAGQTTRNWNRFPSEEQRYVSVRDRTVLFSFPFARLFINTCTHFSILEFSFSFDRTVYDVLEVRRKQTVALRLCTAYTYFHFPWNFFLSFDRCIVSLDENYWTIIFKRRTQW